MLSPLRHPCYSQIFVANLEVKIPQSPPTHPSCPFYHLLVPLVLLLTTGSYTSSCVFIYFAADLGEYDPKEHTAGYVSEFRFIPNQVEDSYMYY